MEQEMWLARDETGVYICTMDMKNLIRVKLIGMPLQVIT